MEALEMLFTRYSCREFQKKDVEEEKIHTILRAGMSAPSARNMRPYHIIVMKDRNVIETISKTSVGKNLMSRANVCFAIVGDLNINPAYEFVLNDTSSVITNMLNAAHALGLGACWCGQRRDDNHLVKDVLNLGDKQFVAGFIALGYPAQKKEQIDRYDEKKIHIDRF